MSQVAFFRAAPWHGGNERGSTREVRVGSTTVLTVFTSGLPRTTEKVRLAWLVRSVPQGD